MKLKLFFDIRDFWIGLHWDRSKRTLYVLPVPTFGLKIHFKYKTQRVKTIVDAREAI